VTPKDDLDFLFAVEGIENGNDHASGKAEKMSYPFGFEGLYEKLGSADLHSFLLVL